MSDVAWEALPFGEQLDFFKAKKLVPTRRWDDLWQSEHDVGFMVAGITQADALATFKEAIADAMAKGTTLQEFQQQFNEKLWPGYAGPGSAAWRSRVIFETNLRTSYAAGRYQQMTDPDVLAARPFWEYRHGDSAKPRPQHVTPPPGGWNGVVLRADDPFWNTHYPPNGWGCTCKVFSLSPDDLADMGKDGPDESPKIVTHDILNKKTGVIYKDVPEGIDPGFAYQPGAKAHDVEFAQTFAAKIADFEARLGAKTFDAARDHVKEPLVEAYGDWVDEILARGQAKGETRVIGAMSETTVKALAERNIVPASAAIAIDDDQVLHILDDAKEDRGAGIGLEAAKTLPAILAEPKAVLLDTEVQALLYVFDIEGSKRGKVVVRVNFRTEVEQEGLKVKKTLNSVRTAGVVQVNNLKAARYQQIEGAL